jgi:hypothetical protein
MLVAMSSPTHPTRRPLSRGWYVAALIIAFAGWVGMALFLVARLSGSADAMIRVLVPGESELRLKEPGRYTIFHEYRSIFEGGIYNVDSIAGLRVTLRSRESGATLPLRQTASSRYTVGSRSGRSLFAFDVPAPGAYVLVGAYPDGRREPQTVLAIDRGFVGGLLITIFGALAMAFGGTALGVLGAIFVWRHRRRHM